MMASLKASHTRELPHRAWGQPPGAPVRLLAICLLLVLGAPAVARTAGAEPDPGAIQSAPEASELPKVEPPPALDSLTRQKLGRALKKLRTSNQKRLHQTEKDLIAFGRGAIPMLVDAAKSSHPGVMAGVQHGLVELVDLRDRELVADSLESGRVTLRRFAVQACGRLAYPPLLDRLPERLQDEDTEVATLAALALAANGREEGLSVLVDAWVAGGGEQAESSRWNAPILAALAGLRGAGPHRSLVARLVIDPRAERDDPKAAAAVRLAAVDMLAALGDEVAVVALGKALEDHHNLVQRSAINALRELIEHKPPFEGATFQQIKELERLREMLRHWRGFPSEDDGA